VWTSAGALSVLNRWTTTNAGFKPSSTWIGVGHVSAILSERAWTSASLLIRSPIRTLAGGLFETWGAADLTSTFGRAVVGSARVAVKAAVKYVRVRFGLLREDWT